ncbi:MAG: phosphopantothenoylcysteine decarboxylase [Elusimicrobiota bacterium]
MKPKNILITAGPTKEYIDPVRFISNDSSGRMGYLLAEESKKQGAKVVLISGPTGIKIPKNVKVVNVVSAEQMFGCVKKYFKKCDVFISCAAVSDYKPERFYRNKIRKTNKPINLKLIPNPDIVSTLAHSPTRPLAQPSFVVGFALETEDLIKKAQKKLKQKKLDMIIANTIDSINSEKTTGAIITKNKIETFTNITKKLLAKKIINKILL